MSIVITDSVTQACVLNVGAAPPVAMGLTYVAMANIISQVMNNAVTAEQSSQVIQNACVAQTCALIIAVGAAAAA